MALGVAVYFNTPLQQDVTPLRQLLADVWDGAAVDNRFGRHAYFAPGVMKLKRRAGYKRDAVLAAIAAGSADSFLLSPRTLAAEADGFELSVDCAAADALPIEARDRLWRYALTLAIGANHVAAIGHEPIIDSVVRFADAVAACAGVILPASSDNAALALTKVAEVDGLTRDERRRIRPLVLSSGQWGDKIRGPEWGTIVSASHVAQLGGLSKLRARDAWHVRSLSSGGAYIQLTEAPTDLTSHALQDAAAYFADIVALP